MYDIPDHPEIRHIERTGYPSWHRNDVPVCPVCGAECRIVYKDYTNDIVGCDECLTPTDATDEEECFRGWSE